MQQRIDIDHNQKDDVNGQRISDVFHLGDVFVDGIEPTKADGTIGRFIKAFFGDPKASPNKDEYGLYIAAAASLRSADLSRQVGAAIFSEEGEIISLGCNEVPKAGGGTYWIDDDPPIFRDVDVGQDANQDRKTRDHIRLGYSYGAGRISFKGTRATEKTSEAGGGALV